MEENDKSIKTIKKEIIDLFLFYMVSPGRIELPTYRLGGDCSIQLSYEDISS